MEAAINNMQEIIEESKKELKEPLANFATAVIESTKNPALSTIENVVDKLIDRNERKLSKTIPKQRIGRKPINIKEMEKRWAERKEEEKKESEVKKQKELETAVESIVEKGDDGEESEIEVIEEGASESVCIQEGESSKESESESEIEKKKREKVKKRKLEMEEFKDLFFVYIYIYLVLSYQNIDRNNEEKTKISRLFA